MKLSILIPVFNEENTVKNMIDKVLSVNVEKELIIIDDASTDGTMEVLYAFRNNPVIKILRHERNMGKGCAIKTAIPHISGELSIIQDADLEYEPQEIPALMEPIINGKADVVYGSRFLRPNKNIYLTYYMGNKFLSLFISALFFKRITDSYTCYKLFKTEILKKINISSSGFEMEAEITSKLLKYGYRILEIPISYNPRRIEEGKKICWKDAVKGILKALSVRLSG